MQLFSELLALEELKGSEYCAQHVAAESHGEVNFISIYDAQKDEMGVNLIDFASYFAQNIADYAQDIVGIDLIDLSQFDQPMIVINIRTNSFLYCLQLR